MWLDWWHPIEALYGRYGYRVVYDVGSSLAAKLSSGIFEGVGNGLLLNLKKWWKSKVNFLNLNLEREICLFRHLGGFESEVSYCFMVEDGLVFIGYT